MVGDEDASGLGWGQAPAPPARVSLAPFSPFATTSPSRLSSRLGEPGRSASPARRKIAWVSLEGRLIGAPEATSARAVGGGLARVEAAAWELFSPLHRVLLVAVVAVAAAKSRTSRTIAQLQRSVDLRDGVLLDMQQKLDGLCEHMNSLQNQSMTCSSKISFESDQFKAFKKLQFGRVKSCRGGSEILELNPESGITPLCGNPFDIQKDINGIESGKEEMVKTPHATMVEQEERRMSDLSDMCLSVTSSLDIQLSSLAAEQEFYNLQKECEGKNVTIKELAAAAHASSVAESKRIMDLEQIISRKNMVISKLKKDTAVLEQKVVELTRLRRASYATSSAHGTKLPVLATNLLYDMNSTSPSSSDSDSPVEYRELYSLGSVTNGTPQQQIFAAMECQKGSVANDTCQHQSFAATESKRKPSAKSIVSSNRSLDRLPKQRFVSPLKENRNVQRTDTNTELRLRHLISSSGDSKRNRRKMQHDSTTLKRRI